VFVGWLKIEKLIRRSPEKSPTDFRGRLLADYGWDLIKFIQCDRDFLTAQVKVYRIGNDYALYQVIGDGLDTAEVWGSSPHAPTKFIQQNHKFSLSARFSLAPKSSN